MQRKATKKVLECVEKESIVQAVVIIDNYNNNFSPATNKPCLMSLVNRPLLDYTLGCLSFARVQEVILFCSTHADQIKEFIRNGSWGRMAVSVVVSEGCRSLGDAMRDLDAKSLIRGDFILVTGTIIGNLKLIPVIERHKKWAATEKGLAMTLIYKECGGKLRSPENDIVVASDSFSNRIVYFNNSHFNRKIEIPLETILERSDIDIRCDILDTGISICSVTVPPLFSDNFDFQTKDDFVRGLLMNDEILESCLYSYILPSNEYCANISNWQNYHSVSHDVIHRWTFPHVPDNTEEMYSFKIQNIYIQDGVSLAKGCSIIEDVVIGTGSKIGANAKISTSVIGKNCEILEVTSIANSHLFSNVIVKGKCNINYCVLGEGCLIEEGCEISDSIVGPGVVIGAGKIIKSQRLHSKQSLKGAAESTEFGPKAFVYQPQDDYDRSDSEEDEGWEEGGGMGLGDGATSWIGLTPLRIDKEEGYEESEDEESEETEDRDERESLVAPDDTNLFYNEVVDSLLRGLEDKIPCENLILEINSSRYAYNVTVSEVNYHVTRALFSLTGDNPNWEPTRDALSHFLPLLKNYMRNKEAMNDCLTAIEDEAEHKMNIRSYFVKILHTLYDRDVLAEEAILHWNNSPREDFTFSIQLRKQIAPFIRWLQEADEESSEED